MALEKRSQSLLPLLLSAFGDWSISGAFRTACNHLFIPTGKHIEGLHLGQHINCNKKGRAEQGKI